MSKKIRDQTPTKTTNRTMRLQVWLSILLTLHFFSVGLSYATNWRRSSMEDRVLMWFQPYLIGTNWYQEMLPVEWISENNRPERLKLFIQNSDEPKRWVSVFGRGTTANTRSKIDRLLSVLGELSGGGDDQGMTRVLKSIVRHLDHSRPDNTTKIIKIRLEKTSSSNSISDSETELFEASVAWFANGEFGFIPKVDPRRSVRVLEIDKVTP